MNIYPIHTERVFYRSPSEHLVLKATILQSYHKGECEKALKELIQVHPRLSCTVEEDEDLQIYYKTNPDRNIPVSYFVGARENDWKAVVKSELKRPFLLDRELSIRVCIIDNHNEFDLIMIMHHMMGDGLSLLYLYQDFLQIYFYNSKLAPKDSRPLKRSDLPKGSSLNLVTKAVIHHLNHIWKKEVPQYQNSDFPALFHNFHKEFDCNFSIGLIEPAVLRQLYEKSHEYNVTINSILVTALLCQLVHSPITTKEEQKVIVATNLRKRLLLDPDKCVGNYAACISPMLSIDQFKDFWVNAKEIHEKLQRLLTSNKDFFALSQTFEALDTSIFDGLYFNGYSDFHSENVKKVIKVLKAGVKEEGFNISNLGRFSQDSSSKLMLAKNFVYLPPISSSCDITVGVVTVSNQMSLSLLYNENRFDHQEIESILQCTLALLTKISKTTSKGEHNEKESESENVI